MNSHSKKRKPAGSLQLRAGELCARMSVNIGTASVLQVTSFRKRAAPSIKDAFACRG